MPHPLYTRIAGLEAMLMRTSAAACLLFLLLGCSSQDAGSPPVQATLHTKAVWTRNAEAEQVQSYYIYLCDVPRCTVEQTNEMFVDNVLQPPLGEQPEWRLPPGITGALAVSAVNSVGESPLSASAEFAS